MMEMFCIYSMTSRERSQCEEGTDVLVPSDVVNTMSYELVHIYLYFTKQRCCVLYTVSNVTLY